jgi:GH24 family phage-related lysozyme (muramidase)
MGDVYKILHWQDVLKCNHGGTVQLNPNVEERNAEINENKRILCDADLLGSKVTISGCSIGCTHVVSIEKGRALQMQLKETIPLLGDLQATSDKGCLVIWDGSLAAQLAREEGLELKAYQNKLKDGKLDKLTVGIGHNVEASPVPGVTQVGDSITMNQAYSLFATDQANAESQVSSNFDSWSSTSSNPVMWNDLTPGQQQAMTDLAFNMGPSFNGWPNFKADMKSGNFQAASDELAKGTKPGTTSQYVKDVGPTRSGNVRQEILGNDGKTEAFAKPQ